MMSFSTPRRPLESSAKRLLKRIDKCTELSFEQTPIRHTTTKRKTIRMLTSTMSSGISLLSNENETLFSDLTVIDDSILSFDRTIRTKTNKKNIFNSTTSSSSWEIIDSVNNNTSEFSIVSINPNDVSQAVIINKRSKKVFNRPCSLLVRLLKLSMPKTPMTSIKYINRYIRDIDRMNEVFDKQWITLPNFV